MYVVNRASVVCVGGLYLHVFAPVFHPRATVVHPRATDETGKKTLRGRCIRRALCTSFLVLRAAPGSECICFPLRPAVHRLAKELKVPCIARTSLEHIAVELVGGIEET